MYCFDIVWGTIRVFWNSAAKKRVESRTTVDKETDVDVQFWTTNKKIR